MPGLDKTGPQGKGPGSGRRRGICFGDAAPADMSDSRGSGRGLAPRGGGRGRSFGGGRGIGAAGPGKAESLQLLKKRESALEQDLAAVRSRIDAYRAEKD